MCVHTGESRRQVRREKLVKENLPVCTGLNELKLSARTHGRISMSSSARKTCQGKFACEALVSRAELGAQGVVSGRSVTYTPINSVIRRYYVPGLAEKVRRTQAARKSHKTNHHQANG